jgi:hypothetical protein
MRSPTLSASEKAAITHTCQTFIDTVLKPRFLPNVHVTPFNYPVDIQGKWHGNKYVTGASEAPGVRLDG